MTEMFGEAWSPMSVPDLAPDDDIIVKEYPFRSNATKMSFPFKCLDHLAVHLNKAI